MSRILCPVNRTTGKHAWEFQRNAQKLVSRYTPGQGTTRHPSVVGVYHCACGAVRTAKAKQEATA